MLHYIITMVTYIFRHFGLRIHGFWYMTVCQWANTSEHFEKAQSLQLQGSSSQGRPAGGRGMALYRQWKEGEAGTPIKGEEFWRGRVLKTPEKGALLDAAEKI
jgi:hypothetical protein